jgi:hypothetical protein
MNTERERRDSNPRFTPYPPAGAAVESLTTLMCGVQVPVVDSFELANAAVGESKRRPGDRLLHRAGYEDFTCVGFARHSCGCMDCDSDQLSISACSHSPV